MATYTSLTWSKAGAATGLLFKAYDLYSPRGPQEPHKPCTYYYVTWSSVSTAHSRGPHSQYSP